MAAAAAAAAAGGALEAALTTKIREYLDVCVYDTARFLSERLVSHSPTEENIYLLATCYARAGRPNRAVAVLAGARRAENRYLLAACCLELGRFSEAEDALLDGDGDRGLSPFSSSADDREVPLSASGMYLMGRICKRANRRQQAIEYFVKSLELDPFLWSAYEALCDLGANADAAQFFGESTCFIADPVSNEEVLSTFKESEPERASSEEADNNDAAGNDGSSDESFSTPRPRSLMELATPLTENVTTRPKPGLTKPPYHLAFKTPVAERYSNEAVKKPRMGGGLLPAAAAPNNKPRKAFRRPLADSEEKAWRHGRLSFSSMFSDDSPQQQGNDSAMGESAFTVTQFSDNDGVHKSIRAFGDREERTRQGQQELRRLLSSFGAIYQLISAYQCREALDLLERLPHSQRRSGWVMQQTGRAYFEMADYQQAHDVYRAMFRAEPHRMEGLDLYSTALWHLKKEVELSYLAQQLTDFDRLSREAWCVAGNCFSLQKEHDTALTFIQRAIQLDPTYTYAYTLAGHEYVANEDFDKAINCYRHAIRTDARHYNAWYGLGTIYYRQEKFEFAEYHFQRALEINPRSSLLHCFLGMVLHAMHRFDDALAALAIAGELQPLNPQARFQRANVLITQQRFEEALAELRVVRTFAPRESSVHFMMGRVAKRLGRREDALRYFTTALYFHPKDNNLIRAAIDKINESDFDDDERL